MTKIIEGYFQKETKKLDPKQREVLIHEYFYDFEEKFDCTIKREGDYINFPEDRLIEHMTYWYLDFRLKRRVLDQKWKNVGFRNYLIQQFKTDPFNRHYLDQLF